MRDVNLHLKIGNAEITVEGRVLRVEFFDEEEDGFLDGGDRLDTVEIGAFAIRDEERAADSIRIVRGQVDSDWEIRRVAGPVEEGLFEDWEVFGEVHSGHGHDPTRLSLLMHRQNKTVRVTDEGDPDEV